MTCDQITQLGQSVIQLEVSQLQTLSASEYRDCAYQLGRVVNFTSQQWQALAGVAKEVCLHVVMSSSSLQHECIQ